MHVMTDLILIIFASLTKNAREETQRKINQKKLFTER